MTQQLKIIVFIISKLQNYKPWRQYIQGPVSPQILTFTITLSSSISVRQIKRAYSLMHFGYLQCAETFERGVESELPILFCLKVIGQYLISWSSSVLSSYHN